MTELLHPVKGMYEPRRRRARVLAWIQLTLIALLSLTLILVGFVIRYTQFGRMILYLGLTGSLLFWVGSALVFNLFNHYSISAGITVLAAFLGPWGAICLDPQILQGDIVPMTYLVISVLLSAILLPIRWTIGLAVLQYLVLLCFPMSSPALGVIKWPSTGIFVLMASVLAIVSNNLTRMDLAQIDQQQRLLAESEARLKELAIRDGLTGLYNRRYLDELLTREIQRAEREHLPLGLMMLDIDRFKEFNDRNGHAAGDEALSQISAFLAEHTRRSDVVCRYGGEEFVIILPGAATEVVLERAKWLCDQVRHMPVIFEGQATDGVTISIGVAAYPQYADNGQMLLRAANLAMYDAKRTGRDRVALAQYLPKLDS